MNIKDIKTSTYWRVHWHDCPEFSAENAKSVAWDGWDAACPICNGEGTIEKLVERWTDDDELEEVLSDIECSHCKGNGVITPQDGYSCCESAKELSKYFRRRLLPTNTDAKIVVFSGEVVDYGIDGEPLVVPDMEADIYWLDPEEVWAQV